MENLRTSNGELTENINFLKTRENWKKCKLFLAIKKMQTLTGKAPSTRPAF